MFHTFIPEWSTSCCSAPAVSFHRPVGREVCRARLLWRREKEFHTSFEEMPSEQSARMEQLTRLESRQTLFASRRDTVDPAGDSEAARQHVPATQEETARAKKDNTMTNVQLKRTTNEHISSTKAHNILAITVSWASSAIGQLNGRPNKPPLLTWSENRRGPAEPSRETRDETRTGGKLTEPKE